MENVCEKLQKCTVWKFRTYMHICKNSVTMDHTCYILTEADREEQTKTKNTIGRLFRLREYDWNWSSLSNLIIAEKLCANCVRDLQTQTSSMDCTENCA